jgi:hypothetical protein
VNAVIVDLGPGESPRWLVAKVPTDATVIDVIEGRKGETLYHGDDEEEARKIVAVAFGNLDGGGVSGIPLHEQLAAAADHVEYEAEVVEDAAEELPPGDVKDAAEDQAEAMHDAAEALDEAADEARDAAAEIFTETGTPEDVTATEPTPEGDVVGGNPFAGFDSFEDCVAKVTAKGGIADPEAYCASIKRASEGNYRYSILREVALGNQSNKEWYKEGYERGKAYEGDPENAPDPLSGEWAGESIPEIFGSWEAATDEAMESYEIGYWAAVYGNPERLVETTVDGNPGEIEPPITTDPVEVGVGPADIEVEAPGEVTVDIPPKISHWYFRPLRIRKG